MRFYGSGLYISPLAPLLLGFATGILTILLGIGGGFVLVPAMIYLLGMSTAVVVGTSLFQILFVTAAATMVHATTTKAVDIVLAALLLIGSVVGAQVGARFAAKARPELPSTRRGHRAMRVTPKARSTRKRSCRSKKAITPTPWHSIPT